MSPPDSLAEDGAEATAPQEEAAATAATPAPSVAGMDGAPPAIDTRQVSPEGQVVDTMRALAEPPEPAVEDGSVQTPTHSGQMSSANDGFQSIEDSTAAEPAVTESPTTRDETAETASSPDDDAAEVDDQSQSHPLMQDLLLNPSRWRIWPATAILKWLQRRLTSGVRRIVFRSKPSLNFEASEVNELQYRPRSIELVLSAPGLATVGSPLPTSDVARIVADYNERGPMSTWLDGPGDRFMHVLEGLQQRTNIAYALMIGGRVEAYALLADIVGRSATLSAAPGGRLRSVLDEDPQGAVGLASLFPGPATHSGLVGLVHAFTRLPTRVQEFAGALVANGRPARVGLGTGLVLGAMCDLPSAGVEVHIEGGLAPEARRWAQDAWRRRSLHLLVAAYIGSATPTVRIYLWLHPENVPPAALDDVTALGGLPVLGVPTEPVQLPLSP